MKFEDLGINPKTGYHDRRLTRAESRLVGILWTDHEGEGNKLSADVLAVQYYTGIKQTTKEFLLSNERKTLEKWKRNIRDMQNHILFYHDHIPFHSKSGIDGGYYIAETEEEGEAFYRAFITRGRTGIKKGVRGKQASLVEVVEQLSFEFDDLDDRTAVAVPMRRPPEMSTPIKVVDAMLEKMLAHPEKFEAGIRKLRQKYSGILLPREQVAAMKAKARELQEMVSSLGG